MAKYRKGKYAKRKKPYRRSSSSSVGKNARAIKRLNRRTGGFQGLEVKFLDTSIASTAIINTANMSLAMLDPTTLDCLNGVATGTTPSTRLGRNIVMKSIKVKGRVNYLEDAVDSSVTITADRDVVLYLVLDRQTNEAQMPSDELFINQGNVNTLLARLFRNLEHTERYQILDSASIKFKTNWETTGTVNFARNAQHRDFTLTYSWPKGRKVLYSGVGNTVGAITDDSLHVVAFSTGVETQCQYNARLRFTTT